MMRYVKIAQLEKPVSVIGLGTSSRAFTPNTYDRAAESLDSDENFERLQRAHELAVRKNVTLPQIGLAYVLQQAFPVFVLVGPTTVSNLHSALGAVDVELTLEEMDFFDLNIQSAVY